MKNPVSFFTKIPCLTSRGFLRSSAMFTMAKITNGSSYLGLHLTQNDYYNENESIEGQWVGKLAQSFGLNQGIQAGDSAFENLRNNLTPDGSDKLTQRTNTERAATKKDALKALRLSEKYREGGKPSDAEIETWLKEHPTTSNRIAFFDFQCSAQKTSPSWRSLLGTPA